MLDIQKDDRQTAHNAALATAVGIQAQLAFPVSFEPRGTGRFPESVVVSGQELLLRGAIPVELEGAETVTGGADPWRRQFVAAPLDSPKMTYLFGSGKGYEAARESEFNPERAYSRRRPITADKLEVREIAQTIGILEQPRYSRYDSIDGTRLHKMIFADFAFDLLPVQSLESATPGSAIAFEREDTGFEIRKVDVDSYVLHSTNTIVNGIIESVGADGICSKEKVEHFLAALSSSRNFEVRHIGEDNEHLDFEVFRSRIARQPDGDYFLKSDGGSKGYHVLRIGVKDGAVITADLPHFQQEFIESKLKKPYSETTTDERLKHMIRSGGSINGAAILEHAIATERVNGVWSEQRAVFYFAGKPIYLMAYSKVGSEESGDVVPNRAQGGSAENYRDSFRRILSERMNCAADTLENAVEDTAERMKKVVTDFAVEFAEIARARGYCYGPIFAIDLCPVWNEASKQIDFFLLEVQPGPGTEGAFNNLSPEEQSAVDAYNASVSDDDLDLMC